MEFLQGGLLGKADPQIKDLALGSDIAREGRKPGQAAGSPAAAAGEESSASKALQPEISKPVYTA